MTTPFKQALTLLRDLADMQNGEKKDNCTCCPECGCKEYVNKNLVGDGYRMCRECHQDWWIDINYSSKFCKPLIDRVYDFLNEHEEPIGKPTEEEIKHRVIKSCPDAIDLKQYLEYTGYKNGVITLSEPLDCKKIQWSGKDGELTSLVAKIAKQYQSEGRKGSILPIGFIQRKKDEKHPLFEYIEETTRPPKGMHPKTWAFLNEGKN